MTQTHERGNPDWHEPVHYMTEIKGKQEPICRTGAWNILYTYNKTHVTCDRCLKRIEK